MWISLIRNNYFAKFVPVNFLIQGNVTLGLMSAVCRKRNSKSLDFLSTTTCHDHSRRFGIVELR